MFIASQYNDDKKMTNENPDTITETKESDKISSNNDNVSKTSILYDIIGLFIRIAWIGLIFAFVFMFIIGITVNRGDRMTPAFHNDDIVIFYKLAKDIETEECVVYVGENNKLLVGRVVAKDGDTVDITSDGLMINGYYRTENYATGDTVLFEEGVKFPITLSQGEYFVLCDERSEGNDSRILGAFSSDEIKGRVLISIRHRDF